MKVMRDKVFETNSSAVHSLAIAKEGLEPSYLNVDKDGYIVTDFGDFGDYDMGITTFDQNVKLSYLATECYYLNHYNENIEESYTWNDICDAICEYTGAPGVRVLHNTEPSINHQAIPEYETKFCNPWDCESVNNFIFNGFVGIDMTHD